MEREEPIAGRIPFTANALTGGLSPTEFRIPRFPEENMEEALRRGETDHPPLDGMLVLRKALQDVHRV